MAGEAQRLLDAETAVNELLETLESLKAEVEGYAQAKETLETLGEHLGGTTSSVGRLAEQSRSIIEALGTIGTPEILSQVERLATSENELVQTVKSDLSEVTKRVSLVREAAEQMLQALAQVTKGVQASQDSTVKSVREAAGLLQQQIERCQAGIHELASASQTQAQMLEQVRKDTKDSRDATGKDVRDISGQLREQLEESRAGISDLFLASQKTQQNSLAEFIMQLSGQVSTMETRLRRRFRAVVLLSLLSFLLSAGLAGAAILYATGLLHKWGLLP